MTDVSREEKIGALLLICFSYLQIIPRYVALRIGSAELPHNVVDVWLPFAHAVLQGGKPYLSQWDNKPPLFHFVNLLAAWTDHYVPVFLVLLATANAATALLVWVLCRRHGRSRAGFVAGVLFLAASPGLLGMTIDPRQFAAALALSAFVLSRAWKVGVVVAAAGLFSQYSVLLIPAVVWYQVRDRTNTKEWLLYFCAAGLLTVAVSFLLVALVWGPDAAWTGFKYSFFALSGYTAKYTEMGFSAFGDPVRWAYLAYRLFASQLVLSVVALLGLLAVVSKPTALGKLALLSALLMTIPTLIRPVPLYYFAALPFYSILGVLGIRAALVRDGWSNLPAKATTEKDRY